MEFSDFALRIGVALIGGLLIGVEREYKRRSAGLKTNAIVSVGAAVFMLVSLKYRYEFGVDITRVLSQVVVGIGFLGAGVILKKGDKIEGLTTAATVWCSAAIGCMASVAMYVEVAFITALIIIVNILFGLLEKK